MVKVKQDTLLTADGSIDLETWLRKLSERNPEIDLSRVRKVCELSERAEWKATSTDGTSSRSFAMGLEIADILGDLRVNEAGIKAAVIYRAVRENQITLNHVRKQCGDEVAVLVEGVLRMAAISNIRFGERKPVLGQRKDQLEQAKRMLVAVVDDVRVLLIKLAERTAAIRANRLRSPQHQLTLAREVFEIYAPLAHRLGIGSLKWELEDLSFRYLEPHAYKRIASLLSEKRSARQSYIDSVIAELDRQLQSVGVGAHLEGRAKHIYSIWKKMRSKGIAFSEVYDVRAIRIRVGTSDDCYRALGVVHSLWRNIPHEFDDYIATPKENGYRSLHTAVIGPEGKILEVQIRTEEMHEEAEFGVCSHWRYKKVARGDSSSAYEERLEWLRQVLDWQDVPDLAREILENVGMDRVYVYTPNGHVIDMSPGATPVDFAYRVHTEVGHKCRGAKVNGQVVPLNTPLKSGDQVEVIIGDTAEPRREWLHGHLGYVTTSRARSKIHAWFGQREKQKNIDEGKKLLLDELSHLGIEQLDFSRLAEKLELSTPTQLFYAIGSGDVSTVDVVDLAAEMSEIELRAQQLDLGFDEQGQERAVVEGLGDLKYVISDCCRPVHGDSIVGVIDDDNVVHVHLQDCLQALHADVYGRIIRLNWQEDVSATFPVSVEVNAYDRPGLLYDVTGILMRERTNVRTIYTVFDKETNRVSLKMVIEVSSLNLLLTLLDQIGQLPNVISARRAI
ncbi:MAG: bifunctional (p)ppGpp synthetase/guanosine-3',5'-bis(diphosphate) 3'-pyrophosphohydrolase [Proteobacteria bacterium]|nr:bifunctional (p)ppGpp synthetase/guanosine-3',5'-bis(diphosphate) 3'-pyrophosphohydrolase [Pseudomonadota bacterium]MDA1300595.1 bifunctional (p)ppGpp synthetase/guanosine-3',5'-bis(diphosphate) 3'-pyrophosphohydrolase [Pseudomonadota bacterium]